MRWKLNHFLRSAGVPPAGLGGVSPPSLFVTFALQRFFAKLCPVIRLCCAFLFLAAFWANAACTGCSSFGPGINWGMVLASTPHEASGMAASARNPGVLWTHNDGPRSRIYALSTNGSLLATCNFGPDVGDFEDIAVGGGFIYIGDIGGSQFVDGTRSQIRILRTPEPSVSLDWAANPVS